MPSGPVACVLLSFVVACLLGVVPGASGQGTASLKDAVLLYASFDEKMEADRAGGAKTLSTRYGDPKGKGFRFEPGYPSKAFRIARGKGISGGALEAVDVLPESGRVFFPAKGNIAFKKGGWGGAVSTWINTDPNTLLKTTFCDPVQITQKGANNGGIWYDFNNARPRDLRMGVFPAVPAGQKGASESDADAPMVRVPGVKFKQGEWHHVVITWDHFDTGKADAVAILYIDGKRIGAVEKRPIAMDWDIDKAGIYIAVNFIGLLDEFAVFGRPLSADEVMSLHKNPGMLK